jgi:hypothetical protein
MLKNGQCQSASRSEARKSCRPESRSHARAVDRAHQSSPSSAPAALRHVRLKIFWLQPLSPLRPLCEIILESVEEIRCVNAGFGDARGPGIVHRNNERWINQRRLCIRFNQMGHR